MIETARRTRTGLHCLSVCEVSKFVAAIRMYVFISINEEKTKPYCMYNSIILFLKLCARWSISSERDMRYGVPWFWRFTMHRNWALLRNLRFPWYVLPVITFYRWYHAGADAQAADKILRRHGSGGSFLVRPSQSSPGELTLSIRSVKPTAMHCPISWIRLHPMTYRIR